jgi:hypothetical protein
MTRRCVPCCLGSAFSLSCRSDSTQSACTCGRPWLPGSADTGEPFRTSASRIGENVKIRYQAAAVVSVVAITAALGLALPGAAGASPARLGARSAAVSADSTRSAASVTPDTSSRYGVCDEPFDCWTNEGRDNPLSLTGETPYQLYDVQSMPVNGKPETVYELKSDDGDCVTANPGGETIESSCINSNNQFFWLTSSDAMYSVGVSLTEGSDWCELDTNGHVQNTPCPNPSDQSAEETFNLYPA